MRKKISILYIFCNTSAIFNQYLHILILVLYKGGIDLNNMDINKLLAAISKMDKEELEKNIYKAQQILENSNIKKDINKGDE